MGGRQMGGCTFSAFWGFPVSDVKTKNGHESGRHWADSGDTLVVFWGYTLGPFPSPRGGRKQPETTQRRFPNFSAGRKTKNVTNRVAIGPIRAILCAQKAMFLGYMLGRFRALGRLKKSPKIAPESFPRQWEKSSNTLC